MDNSISTAFGPGHTVSNDIVIQEDKEGIEHDLGRSSTKVI